MEPRNDSRAEIEEIQESAAENQGRSPSSAQLIIPECESANPLAAEESRAFYGSIDVDVSGATGPVDLGLFNRLSGPVAQQAMSGATEVRGCQWPLYLAGNSVTQYTTRLGGVERNALISGLRDSDYGESELGPAALFTYSFDDPESFRMVGPTTIQYVFVDELWIAIFETGASDYSQSALDALIASNPQLAG